MEKMRLIHPIYLDVPMLVSFAAAMQGGLSLQADVTHETEGNKAVSAKLSGKFGFNSLFSKLFDLSVDTDVSGLAQGRDQEVRRESRSHTEASIAILLYDQLHKTKGYVLQPKTANELLDVGPGTLVEVAGTLVKNAVDSVIDYLDAIDILSGLENQAIPAQSTMPKPAKSSKPPEKTKLRRMREVLDADRKRTPIANVILRCKEPFIINVIMTLRTANLRDLTLTELHKNDVRAIGKVTRIVQQGEAMSAFGIFGLWLLSPDTLKEMFNKMQATEGIVAEFSEVEVQGPTVQILPLMVFV